MEQYYVPNFLVFYNGINQYIRKVCVCGVFICWLIYL